MAAPLADLADLEAHLGRTVDPVVGDAALANASGVVRAWCGWVISLETITFTTQGNGTTVLALPTLHLVDVTEVRIDGVALPALVTDPAGYGWYAEGQLVRTAGWPGIPRGVQVDCDHGYDPVPDAVKAVTVSVAGRAATVPGGVKRDMVGTVLREYFDAATSAFSTLDAAVLGPFRLPLQP